MKDWTINSDGTVTLKFEEGTVTVSKKDFDRAFGTMVNSSKKEIERDFGVRI